MLENWGVTEKTYSDEQYYVDLSIIALVEQAETSHISLIVEDLSSEKEGQTGGSRSLWARNLEGRPSTGLWFRFADIPPYK